MRLSVLTLVSASILSMGAALAQAPAPVPAPAPAAPQIRAAGTITAAEPGKVTLKTESGTATVMIAATTRLSGATPGTSADVKPGSYIGAGARPQADGTLNAVQIYIFPEAQRGTGEGHRAWGVLPETTMTNATVEDAVSSVSAGILTLKYKDGEKKLRIVSDTAILVAGSATAADLTVGTWINAVGTATPEGPLAAARVTIGLKGAKPI